MNGKKGKGGNRRKGCKWGRIKKIAVGVVKQEEGEDELNKSHGKGRGYKEGTRMIAKAKQYRN